METWGQRHLLKSWGKEFNHLLPPGDELLAVDTARATSSKPPGAIPMLSMLGASRSGLILKAGRARAQYLPYSVLDDMVSDYHILRIVGGSYDVTWRLEGRWGNPTFAAVAFEQFL